MPLDLQPVLDLVPENPSQAESSAALADHFHGSLTQAVADNKDADGTAKPFTFEDAIKAGWQISTAGLASRQAVPDTVLPETAPWYQSIASKSVTMAGDIPAGVAGAFIGTAAGVETGPGAAVTGMGGAFALPAALRRIMMDAYKNGEAKTPQEFLSLAGATFLDTAKGYITGASMAAGGLGVEAAGGVALKAASPLVQKAVVGGAQLTAMVNVGSGLEGHLAGWQDYLDGGLMLFGAQAAGFGAGKLADIFTKTGVQPAQVIRDAQTDPTLHADLLSGLPVPRAYQESIDPAFNQAPETVANVPALPDNASPLDEANKYFSSKIVSAGEQPREYKSFDELYAQYVDNLDPVKQIVEATNKLDSGEALPATEDSYKLLRLTRGGIERANLFANTHTLDFKTFEPNGESMRSAIEPVRKDIGNFTNYIAAQRSIELEGRGINSGFDLEKAKTIINETSPEKKALFEESSQRLTAYNNRLAAYARDAGLISKEGYGNLVEMNKYFTPFHRFMPDADTPSGMPSGLKTTNPFKAIKGSDRNILNPIESTMANTYKLLSLAERNNATALMVKQAVAQDFTKPGHNGGPPLFEKVNAKIEAINVTNKELSKHISAGGQNETTVGSGSTLPAANGELGPEGTKVTFNPENLGDLPIFRAMWEPLHDDEISFFDQGKRVVYKVNGDPELLKIFKSSPSIMNNAVFKIAAGFTKAYKTGTVLSTRFPPLHMARQNINAMVNSEDDLMLPVVSLAQGIANMMGPKGQERWQQFKSSGALNANIVEWNDRYIQKNINSITEGGKIEKFGTWLNNAKDDPKNIAALGYNVVRHPIDALTMMGKLYLNGAHALIAAHDNTLRFAKFNKVMDRLDAEGVTGKDAILESGYQAREVLLDYYKRGSNIAAANQIIPFLNLRIIGLAKLAELAKSDPSGFAMRMSAAVAVPTILLWFANRNDPRHKEKQDWQRDNEWSIYTDDWREPRPGDTIPEMPGLKGTRGDGSGITGRFSDGGKVGEYNFGSSYQIPKPPETGLLFGSSVERFLDYADSKFTEEKLAHYDSIMADPKTSAEDRKSAADAKALVSDNALGQPDHPAAALLKSFANLLPGEMITAQNPIFEMLANKSNFTGGPVVPSAAESLLPQYQQTEYTTELAKAVGGLIGSIPGMERSQLASPPMIENFVRQWSGTLGMQILRTTSQLLGKAGVLPDPTKPTPSLADNPFIGGFVARFPTASTKSVTDFYDQYDYASKVVASIQDQAKKGNPDAVRVLMAMPEAFQKLDGIRQTITGVQKEIYMISDAPASTGLSADQKRQMIDRLYYNMISTAQMGNQMMRSIAAQIKGNEPKPEEVQPWFRQKAGQ